MAAEHAASSAVSRWLGASFQAAAAHSGDARPVLVGLPPGARHELGALAFATAARRGGLAVDYLGADLPAAEWVRAARATNAAAAVIAVPTADDVIPARRVAAALHRRLPALVVLFGGSGSSGMARASVLSHGIAAGVSELRSRLEV